MRRTTQSATQARTFQLGVFGKIIKWMNLSDTWAPEKSSAETIKWLLHVLSNDASFKTNKQKTEIKQRGKHLRSTPPWSVSLKICLLSRCFLKAQEFVFVYKRPHLCLEKEQQWWVQEHVFHWRRIWDGRYRDVQLQTKHVCSAAPDQACVFRPTHPGCWYPGCEIDVHVKVSRLLNFSLQLMSVWGSAELFPTGTTSAGSCCCCCPAVNHLKADNRWNNQANLIWAGSLSSDTLTLFCCSKNNNLFLYSVNRCVKSDFPHLFFYLLTTKLGNAVVNIKIMM